MHQDEEDAVHGLASAPTDLLSSFDNIRTTEYYFWTGESKLSTVIGSKRRGITKLLKRAGVEGNPHKFRHTLATTLLTNGTSPAIVAKILGNSARVVEKFYDHWIPARLVFDKVGGNIEAEVYSTDHPDINLVFQIDFQAPSPDFPAFWQTMLDTFAISSTGTVTCNASSCDDWH